MIDSHYNNINGVASEEPCSNCNSYIHDPYNGKCMRDGHCKVKFKTEAQPKKSEIQGVASEETVTNEKGGKQSIKDSGNRTEFATGAVRDMQTGKGRCDLLPLDVIAEHMEDVILEQISFFQKNNEPLNLWNAIELFTYKLWAKNVVVDITHRRVNMLLDIARHFEDGAIKYGERNWEKGIPIHCYIDSAIRHYLKYLRGDTDEPHDRAFIWNLLCCIWTLKHKPEMQDIPEKTEPKPKSEQSCFSCKFRIMESMRGLAGDPCLNCDGCSAWQPKEDDEWTLRG